MIASRRRGGMHPAGHRGPAQHGADRPLTRGDKACTNGGRRTHKKGREVADYSSDATTVLVMAPMPSISHVTTSPGLRNRGGFRKQPTPGGVPVKMTSPGSRVTNLGKGIEGPHTTPWRGNSSEGGGHSMSYRAHMHAYAQAHS